MATIKDVAKLAGVSVCTVSRTLSNRGYIKDETRKRVMEAVKQLNYQQNKLAVSLKTGRSNVIALIIPDVMNMYYASLAKHMEEIAAAMGYMIYLCNSDNDLKREVQFIDILSQRKVEGVIVTPCTNEHGHVSRLREVGIPYVYLNRIFPDEMDRCIRVDNFKAGYDCTSYLIQQGHKRLGAIFQSFSNMIYEERYKGMRQAMQEHGLVLDETNIIFDDNLDENSVERIMRLLKKKEPPEAIFAANDMLALNVYRAAYNCGIRIPDDLSLMGFDDIVMAEKAIPSLTTYYTPVKELAEMAMKYIDKCLRHKPVEPFLMCEGHLVIRESVKKNA